jgi:hypothetical protein
VLRRPQAMAQFLRYGEEAANVLVKHPGIAEGLVERGGASAVRALGKISGQSARRLAILAEDGLEAAAKPELLEVVAKYGDRAATFIWENKGALAVGVTLAAFVATPEPFLNGSLQLAQVAAETVAKPIATGVAEGTNWTLILLVVFIGGGAILAMWLGLFKTVAAGKGGGSATHAPSA